mmetsp:Transcript_32313/g.105536  ORF Transcript_32313/g.105536 Transcript_32313/m.105536 type:complete len:245 (-) Transcript_32313:513-1247(-)
MAATRRASASAFLSADNTTNCCWTIAGAAARSKVDAPPETAPSRSDCSEPPSSCDSKDAARFLMSLGFMSPLPLALHPTDDDTLPDDGALKEGARRIARVVNIAQHRVGHAPGREKGVRAAVDDPCSRCDGPWRAIILCHCRRPVVRIPSRQVADAHARHDSLRAAALEEHLGEGARLAVESHDAPRHLRVCDDDRRRAGARAIVLHDERDVEPQLLELRSSGGRRQPSCAVDPQPSEVEFGVR